MLLFYELLMILRNINLDRGIYIIFSPEVHDERQNYEQQLVNSKPIKNTEY